MSVFYQIKGIILTDKSAGGLPGRLGLESPRARAEQQLCAAGRIARCCPKQSVSSSVLNVRVISVLFRLQPLVTPPAPPQREPGDPAAAQAHSLHHTGAFPIPYPSSGGFLNVCLYTSIYVSLYVYVQRQGPAGLSQPEPPAEEGTVYATHPKKSLPWQKISRTAHLKEERELWYQALL